MNKLKIIYTSLLLLLAVTILRAENITVKGYVFNGKDKSPIEGAQIFSSVAEKTVITDEKGAFEIVLNTANALLEIEADGFYKKEIQVLKRSVINVYLVPESSEGYMPYVTTQNGRTDRSKKTGNAYTLNKKDLNMVYTSPDQAMKGMFPGLNVFDKSGMPGEGAFLSSRGMKSFVGSNLPLIVVDGMPYLPNTDESLVISGFSRNIFSPLLLKDIENISLIKGNDASMYGSLGSNGVILIETEKATDMETKVEFQTVDGISWLNKRLPLLDPTNFKTYIGDVGETAFNDLEDLVDYFPFLQDNPEFFYDYLYNNNTDWQEEIYAPAFSTENILKVKGGDAIANYALSAGYLNNKGVIDNTNMSKYFTRLNANIAVTKKLSLFAMASFGYNEHNLMEQGMIPETNPLLAAWHKAPILSIYEKDRDGNFLPTLDPVRQFKVSNPKSVVRDIEATSKSYDILVNAGVNYDITSAFSLNGMIGLYYNYDRESLFVPGKTSKTIAPMMNGDAENLVRSGIGEGLNFYFKGEARYANTFSHRHEISAALGYQLITSRDEFDTGEGINTNSDFYKTLDKTTEGSRRTFYGDIDIWNWMNLYARASYNFNRQWFAGASITFDAASSSGKNSGRFMALPSANIAWNLKNASFLKETDWLDNLTLRAEYGLTANSRFSSMFSQYVYTSQIYRDLTGIVRTGLPNSRLKSEKLLTTDIGVDFATRGNRFALSVDLFEERTKDMLLQKNMSAAYGYGYMYENAGELKNQGIDVALQATLINGKHFEWNVGGNISTYRSEIISLGNVNQKITKFSDGTTLISKVGESPYSFYGYVYDKVFASKAEADAAQLLSYSGRQFEAGDVKWKDFNGDHTIDENDMQLLGSAKPDFFGGFYTSLRYKNLSLHAQFTYSYGNKIYNAVRRDLESLSSFNNQSKIAVRRWNYDGQVTDIPKAVYDDPNDNSRFSDRWVEDGSYLKLKNITLTYDVNRTFWFFRHAQIFLNGENLWTCTKYLGLDPEFAYSYDPGTLGMDLGKAPLGKTIKIGLKLQF